MDGLVAAASLPVPEAPFLLAAYASPLCRAAWLLETPVPDAAPSALWWRHSLPCLALCSAGDTWPLAGHPEVGTDGVLGLLGRLLPAAMQEGPGQDRVQGSWPRAQTCSSTQPG